MKANEFFIKGANSTNICQTHNMQDVLHFIPLQLPFAAEQFALAGLFAVGISVQKDLYVWGQLGKESVSKPIKLITMVEKASCGWDHVLFTCKEDKRLYGFGSNKYQQLGKNTKNCFIYQPQVVLDRSVSQFAAGFRQSYAEVEGLLMGCGESKYYQLGVKQKQLIQWKIICQIQQIISINPCRKCVFVHLINKQVVALGTNEANIFNMQIPFISKILKVYENILKIGCGWGHIVLLNNYKKILTYGRGSLGQLGKKQNQEVNLLLQIQEQIVDLKVGTEFVFIRTNKNKLFGWGWNQHCNLIQSKQEILYLPSLISQNVINVWTYPATTIIKKNIL